MSDTVWAGWPADLPSPPKTAAQLVQLSTRIEREALFLKIPKPWHPFIVELAVVGVAFHIVGEVDLERRKAMIAELPEGWRHDVEAHIRRLWERREEIRAGWSPGNRPQETSA